MGQEIQPTRDRGLPETSRAKEAEKQTRCSRHPRPHGRPQQVGNLGHQPPSHCGLRVPALQPGAWTSLEAALRGSAEPESPYLSLLMAPTLPLQRGSARSATPSPPLGGPQIALAITLLGKRHPSQGPSPLTHSKAFLFQDHVPSRKPPGQVGMAMNPIL